jgi:hypothetical protein
MRAWWCGGSSIFKKIVPNLDILDIGALAVTDVDFGTVPFNSPERALDDRYVSVFRCTAEVVYPGCHFCLEQPYPFYYNGSLREIYIDPFGVYFDDKVPLAAFCKEYSQLEQEVWFDNASRHNNGQDWVLLQEYLNLERVTLKHADYVELYKRNIDGLGEFYRKDPPWKELPQEAMIKFVRHTPKLRWFSSDLTQENIALLKEERPEVEFCN